MTIGEALAATFNSSAAYMMGGVVLFVFLDMLTGYIKAYTTKTVNSAKMWSGLVKKCTYLVILVIATYIEMAVKFVPEFGVNVPILIPVGVLICWIEINSILENIGDIYPELKETGIFSYFNKED